MRSVLLTLFFLLIALTGCSSIARQPVNNEPLVIVPDKRIGVIKEAKIGDVIYEEGTCDIINALEMSDSIVSTMPGSMGLPFDFSIRKTVLKPSYQTDRHIYYTAPYKDVLASHFMLGTEIVEGDTVGMRIEKGTGKQQWYVDNSLYNTRGGLPSVTLWYRDKRDADKVTVKPLEIRDYRSSQPFKRITYEGITNDRLIFIYTELSEGRTKDREYQFDIKKREQGTIITLREYSISVTAVTGTGIKYAWLQPTPSNP